jgi:hypothetical protein
MAIAPIAEIELDQEHAGAAPVRVTATIADRVRVPRQIQSAVLNVDQS